MRILFPFGIGLVVVASACVAAPRTGGPVAANADERFRGAERLGHAELQRIIPGMRAMYIAELGSGRRYRGIEYESYQTRPGLHAISLRGRGAFNALWVMYHPAGTPGSYRIDESGLCSILVGETEELCRGVFRLHDGSYALSTYEDPNTPAIPIRLERIR